MTDRAEDGRWMDRALELGARGLGNVWPNPAVGCVLVKDGAVVGEGWTQPGGRPHAEAEALAAAGAAARGATAYVTLEPCAHRGETGPCAEALAGAGVARAVIALEDPDPRVAGRGVEILRDAGVAAELGCRAAEARAANAGFFSRVTRGRPWVTLKLAVSLDGRIALGSGASRWITGEQARAHAHHLRATHDAVLIGAGTARADDPMLDVREGEVARQPVRIVADPGLSIPLTGRLALTAHRQPLWLMHREEGYAPGRLEAFEEIGAETVSVPATGNGALDLAGGLAALGARGLTRVLCEGGGKLAAALIRAGLADELVLMMAGKVIGGDGIPAVAALGLEALDAAPRFRCVETRMLGEDLMSRWLSAAKETQTA